jgi:hypothetical protein
MFPETLLAAARGERVSGPLDAATLEAAAEEGLSGLLARAAEEPPRELRIRAAAIEARSLYHGSELARIITAFGSLPVLALKGPVVSQQLYGDPGVRLFADLDLIVAESDADRGEAVLRGLGYRDAAPLTRSQRATKRRFHSGTEFVHEANGVVIDFHWRFGHVQFPLALPFADAFSRRTTVELDGASIPTLGFADLAVFTSSHAAKHFWYRLETLAQLAALTRLPVDWAEADRIAAAARAARQVGLSFLLAQDVLGCALPPLPRCLALSRPLFPRLRARLARPHAQDPRGRDLFLLLDRRRDVLAAAAAAVFVPTHADWAASRLPDALQWVARPFRLLARGRPAR